MTRAPAPKPRGGPARAEKGGQPVLSFLLRDFEKVVCALLLTGMTLLGFGNVVLRYLTSYSFAASEELLTSGFVILTVFGAAIAARRGEHLAVELFTDILPRPARRLAILLAALLACLLLALSVWFTWVLVQNQLSNGVRSYALRLPVWTFSAVLPFGFALVLIRYLQHLRQSLRGDDA